MKNYLKPLEKFVSYKSIIIPSIILIGINVVLLAAFLICYMIFSFLEKLLLSELSYPILPAIVVLFFTFVSVKFWYDFGLLIKIKVEDKKNEEKIRESVAIDIIGLLPLLSLALLNNFLTDLKHLANPGSVTGGFIANTIIVVVALIIQVLIVEAAVFSKDKKVIQNQLPVGKNNVSIF